MEWLVSTCWMRVSHFGTVQTLRMTHHSSNEALVLILFNFMKMSLQSKLQNTSLGSPKNHSKLIYHLSLSKQLICSSLHFRRDSWSLPAPVLTHCFLLCIVLMLLVISHDCFSDSFSLVCGLKMLFWSIYYTVIMRCVVLRRVHAWSTVQEDMDAGSGKVRIQYWLEVVCRLLSHVLFIALTHLAKQTAWAFVWLVQPPVCRPIVVALISMDIQREPFRTFQVSSCAMEIWTSLSVA